MRKEINRKEISGSIDPLDHFEQTSQQIYEACGCLPVWVIAYSVAKSAGVIEGTTLLDYMADAYIFGLFEMSGGSVTEEYIHQYPDDPDMYPLVVMKLPSGEEFVQWEHAICAMRQQPEDEWFITRMD